MQTSRLPLLAHEQTVVRAAASNCSKLALLIAFVLILVFQGRARSVEPPRKQISGGALPAQIRILPPALADPPPIPESFAGRYNTVKPQLPISHAVFI